MESELSPSPLFQNNLTPKHISGSNGRLKNVGVRATPTIPLQYSCATDSKQLGTVFGNTRDLRNYCKNFISHDLIITLYAMHCRRTKLKNRNYARMRAK